MEEIACGYCSRGIDSLETLSFEKLIGSKTQIDYLLCINCFAITLLTEGEEYGLKVEVLYKPEEVKKYLFEFAQAWNAFKNNVSDKETDVQINKAILKRDYEELTKLFYSWEKQNNYRIKIPFISKIPASKIAELLIKYPEIGKKIMTFSFI
jgi:hypothetical protein